MAHRQQTGPRPIFGAAEMVDVLFEYVPRGPVEPQRLACVRRARRHTPAPGPWRRVPGHAQRRRGADHLADLTHASGIGWSPVGSPVLAVTTGANRPRCCAISRNPI